jgi:hypothetical protein
MAWALTLAARVVWMKLSPRYPGVETESAIPSKYQSFPRLSELSCQL